MLIRIVVLVQLVSAIALVVNAFKLSLTPSGSPVISNQLKLADSLADKKEAKQSPLLEQSVEDEPIVINSVHSGQINSASTGSRRSPRPPRPLNSKRDPAPLIDEVFAGNGQQIYNLSQATLEAKHIPFVSNNNQYQYQYHHQQQQQQQQQQPSQEFDQQSTRNQAQFNNSNRNLWSINKQIESNYNQPKYQQQQQPSRDHYGFNAAPYAVSQQNQAAQQIKQQQHASNLSGQLIRDTSQLEGMNNAIVESEPGSEQFGISAKEPQQHLQSTWMQSVRDNHNGPLRSRHNLTYANHRFTGNLNPNSPVGVAGRTSVIALGGNAHLFDGHMKAKPGPPQLVPYEQQAKSVRNQVPLEAVNKPSIDYNSGFDVSTTSFDNSNNFSRRNSKFTRENDEMTTPINKETFGAEPTVTSNHHAPSAETRKWLSKGIASIGSTTPAATMTIITTTTTTTTTAPKLMTTTTPPPQTNTKVAEEPATGNGHIVALNETDLLILGQNLDKQNIGLKIEDRVEETREEVVQVLENHHIKQQAASKVLNDDNQFGELVVSNNHSNSSKYGNMNMNMKLVASPTTLVPRLGTGSSAKQARRLFSSNNNKQDSVEERGDSSSETRYEAASKSSGSRSWSRLLPTLLQRTLGSVFRRLTGVQQTAASSAANSNTASSSIWSATHQALQQQQSQLPQYQLLQFNSNSAAPNFQQPVGNLNFLTSAALSVASAAAAAATAASRQPNKQQQVGNQASLIGAASASNLDQIDLSNSIPANKQRDATSSNAHETNHPPRQHANKKIIDSFIDLPVSERRQTIERRDGSLDDYGDSSPSSERIQSRAINNVEQLEAEPRFAEFNLDGLPDKLEAAANNKTNARKARSSKTSFEWKNYDHGSKQQEKLLADSIGAQPLASEDYAVDYEADISPKRSPQLSSSQVEADQSTDNENNDELVDNNRRQEVQEAEPDSEAEAEAEEYDMKLDFRTTRAPALTQKESVEVKRINGDGNTEVDPEYLESADSVEDRLYSIASELGEIQGSPESWQMESSESSSEEPEQPVFFRPQPALNLRPSRREYEIIKPPKRGGFDHHAPRNRPGSVIEPSIMYGHDAPEVDQRRRPAHNNKRKRPAQADQVHKRKPGEFVVESNRRPMVPPISVSTAKRGPQSSIAPKPISIFAPTPNVETGEESSSGSNMMSPMSSSINVMDLDPSLTRLAHNKLIVAKFRPKRYKLKTKPTGSVTAAGSRPAGAGVSMSANENKRSSLKPPIAITRSHLSTTTVATPTAAPSATSSTTLVPLPSANRAMDRKPFVEHSAISSLTSAILGTQVMSNNHINDIISRWTRPLANQSSNTAANGGSLAGAAGNGNILGQRSAATAQASSTSASNSPLKPQTSVDTESISSETGGANRRMPDSINGLRIMSDLQHLMPFASNLAAKFSFPTNPQHSRPASSTSTSTTTTTTTSSTTTTTSAPNLSSAFSNHKDHLSIVTNNQNDISSSSSPSSHQNGISKNDKFNFSLVNMNNRERVNPLLFPPDNQRNQQNSFNSSLSKKQSNVRSRPTTTSTTLRPTRPSSSGSSTSAPLSSSTTTTTTTSTSTTTTRRPTVPQKSEQSQSSSATTSSQLSSTHPPQRLPVYHSNRAPPTRSTNRKPAPTTPSDKEIGQTLRSQHQVSKPHAKPTELDRLRNQYLALIGKNSSLDGRQQQPPDVVASSVAPNLPTTSWTNDLPGHITLVTSSLLSNDPPIAFGATSAMEEESIEDGAQDANKYLTLGNSSNSTASSGSNQPIESDHSIVIISDNHHQLRRRPSSSYNRGPSSSPSISMQTQPKPTIFYSSLSPKSESIESTTLPPLFTDYSLSSSSSLSPGQIARKYLEEFVNGSRIRPSSAGAVARTTVEPKFLQNSSHINNWQFNPDQQQQQQQQSNNITSQHDLMPLLVLTNHRSNSHINNNNNNSQATSLESIRRQADLNNAKFNYSYQMGTNRSVFSSANGSPSALDPSSGLLGKLDHRAQELLLDIFDRDPSYSDSVLFTKEGQQQQANVGNSSSFIDLLPSSGAWTNKSDISRKIYNAQMAQEDATDIRFKPTVLPLNEYTNHLQTTLAPPTNPLDGISEIDAEMSMNTRTNTNSNLNSIRPQSLPITLNPIELKQSSIAPSSPPPEDTDTTQLSVVTTSFAGSDDSPRSSTLSTRDEDNRDYTTTTSSTSDSASASSSNHGSLADGSRADLDLGNPDDISNRASMRKNQAKIKEILAALAKKNANKPPIMTTTESPDDLGNEPSIDQQEQQGLISMHFYTTNSVPSQASTVASHSFEKATTPHMPSSDISMPGNEKQEEIASHSISSSSNNNNNNENHNSDHETTKFYAPFKLTTVAAPGFGTNEKHLSQNQNRYQNQSHKYPHVETLSSSRQKINRPSSSHSDSSSSGSIIEYSPYQGSSTPAVPQTTTKLTESLSTNDNLKQIIEHRVTGHSSEHETSVGPQEENNQVLMQETTTEMPNKAGLDHRNELFGRPSESVDKIEDERLGEGSELHYPNQVANDRPVRPVIIRRKPRPKPNRRPILNPNNAPHKIILESGFANDHYGAPNISNKKRRRKPSRRPTTPDDSAEKEPSINENSYGGETITPGELTMGLDEPMKVSEKPVRKPTIVYKPKPLGLQSGSAGLIRKRPAYVRLPPNNIRIQSFAPTNKTIGLSNGKHKPSSLSVPPVSIVLPMESIISHKNQDIRTRPLTIIDPATESSIVGGDSVNDSVVNPMNGLTRIPETTIMHDKMVVTYKPGRPLPGSMSSFGTIGHGLSSSSLSPSSQQQQQSEQYQHQHQHHHHHHHHHNRRPVSDNDSQTAAFSLSTPVQTTTTTTAAAILSPTTTASDTSKVVDSLLNNGTLPQLGSGNGGDTHLVSIEQQQAQVFTTTSRRPPPTTITIHETTQHETSPPTTTPAYPSMIPHRPIIVINGLFDSQNSSMPFDNKLRPNQHNRPHKPNSSHSLIESGSMTVVAHASHGQSNNNNNNNNNNNHNNSRPWYPTVTPSTSLGGGSSSSFQSNRFNTTFGGSSNSSNNDSNNELGSSNQTADSVVGPDIPNFANPGGSASGSYQNHNHEQQQHNQHIGMPHLGPGTSLPLGNRPGQQQKPYRWRVRRRPGSPTASPSNANYNYTPTSAISTYVYRPLAGSLQQFFSFNTLINAYENVLIFFARLRTFLISFMVMFLPPIALAASVATAMSS